jgi:hypothetical protein
MLQTRDSAISSPAAKKASTTSITKSDGDGDIKMDNATNEKDEDAVAKPVQCKRFARAKLGRISAPAKAATEKAQQKPQETASKLATSAPSNVDMTSASFKPDTIVVEVANESAAAAANLESVIQEKKGEKYIDMFWMDIAERNGDVASRLWQARYQWNKQWQMARPPHNSSVVVRQSRTMSAISFSYRKRMTMVNMKA